MSRLQPCGLAGVESGMTEPGFDGNLDIMQTLGLSWYRGVMNDEDTDRRKPVRDLILRTIWASSPRQAAGRVFLAALIGGCQSVPHGGDADMEMAAAPDSTAMAGFLETHCYACHGAKRQKGGLDFETLIMNDGHLVDQELIGRILAVVTSGEMPPKRRTQPEVEEVQAFLLDLNAQKEALLAGIKPDPGRVTVRRLNRAEYNNTVRDLLGVDTGPADGLPPDDSGYGFDNNGDVLTLSPLLAEKYIEIAEDVAKAAVARELEDYDRSLDVHRNILVCDHSALVHNATCADRAIRHLAPQAYRRPISREEFNQLKHFYQLAIDHGESFDAGMTLVIQAMLVSPHFLFRVEDIPSPNDTETHHYLEDYHYASRLSYFLWSSMPDETLLSTVRSGSLRNPRTLRDQIERMLRDPRAAALAENFAGQWLEFRNLQRSDPDPELFPEFNDELREAMAGETSRFFTAIVAEDRSVLDFVNADFTFVNEPLAKLYGIDGIVGPEFQRVSVDPAFRGGLLGQASILTVTSYPTRTSPVLRGLWVLENLLASPTPPPPPDVPALDAVEIDPGATMREKLTKHRENVSCASCHDRIDPLGFGLENYDAIGKWRGEDNGRPVDSSGVLPDGSEFSGPDGLKGVLLERKDDFVRCLAEKMLIYALGRGLEDYDEPALNEIVSEVARNDYRFSALVYEIVRSLPFTKLRGEAESS